MTQNQVCDPVPPGLPEQCHLDAKADVFVAKLDLSLSGNASLIFATYIGGAGKDEGTAVAVDGSGRAYVAGLTVSPDFPAVSPLQGAIGGNNDAFVLRLNSAGAGLDYSTFLGGGGDDAARGIAVDAAGNAYATGYTGSAAFPTANALRARTGGWEAFIARISPSASAPTVPGAPTNLIATPVSQTRIDLSWTDNAATEVGFSIERSANGSTGWAEIAAVAADTTSYSATELTCGSAYYFRVRARGTSEGEFSGYSNTANATTQACNFGKSSPASGAVLAFTSTSLSWGAAVNATEYEYCIDTTNNDTCDATWVSTGQVPSRSISDLASGTTYYWQVRALGASIVYADSGVWWSFTTRSAASGVSYRVYLPALSK